VEFSSSLSLSLSLSLTHARLFFLLTLDVLFSHLFHKARLEASQRRYPSPSPCANVPPLQTMPATNESADAFWFDSSQREGFCRRGLDACALAALFISINR